MGRLKDSEGSFIVNPLAGSADLLAAEKAREIAEGSFADPGELAARGYLVEPQEEQRRYRAAYLDFLDRRDRAETQLFFVPWYSCNFGCPYCYQQGYSPEPGGLEEDVIESFFRYVAREYSDRPAYVTLFGGEPLLPGAGARAAISSFLRHAAAAKRSIAVVTNGYTLLDYLDTLRAVSIREIQVTLDGVEDVHDKRRPLRGGASTFGRIVDGIDAALQRDLPINLRVVVDRENLHALPAPASFAVDRGWPRHPRFKTQLGRNYELHTCQSDPGRLYSRVELYEALYALIKDHPQLLEFHAPAFSLSKFLHENGELPEPLFDACPGCKTEWAFDYTGRIYSCTATVGKRGEELGTFHPAVTRREEMVAQWQRRDVTTIRGCADCSLQLACGGGCAAVAANRGAGLEGPDCRPVKELLGMGMSMYFGKGEQ
jgi:uncharacterized protein